MHKRPHNFGFSDLEVLIDRIAIILIKVASVLSLVFMLIKFLEDQISSW
jgi:hypothetical protein